MLELLEAQYDTYLNESDTILNSAICELNKYGYFESYDYFIESVMESFDKLIEGTKKYVQGLIINVKTKIKTKQLQKKMKNTIDALSENAVTNQRIGISVGAYTSVEKYVKVYNQYVADMAKILVTVANMKYKDDKELRKRYHKLYNDFTKKYISLFDTDPNDTSILIDEAEKNINLSNKELQNFTKNVEKVYRSAEKSMHVCENLCTKKSDPKIIVIAKDICNKISSSVKKMCNWVSTHPIKYLAKLLSSIKKKVRKK